MNEQNQDQHSDADQEFEQSLKAILPAHGDSTVEQSTAQLMYAMGFAAGMSEAQENSVHRQTRNSTNRIWQLSTIAAMLLAACFAILLLGQGVESNSGAVAMNDTGPAKDVGIESIYSGSSPLDPDEARSENVPASSLRSFFGEFSADSAVARRDQILATAGSIDLDHSLELVTSVGFRRWPARSQKRDAGRSLSPRSSLGDLLGDDEFLGL